MRRTMAVSGTLLLAGWALVASHPVWGFPALARQTKAACEACHANVAGGSGLNAVGKAYKADPKAAVPTTAKAVEYVGSNKCKMCHMKQHTAWLKTDHAEAWKALVNADEKTVGEWAAMLKVEAKHPATTSDKCVSCHVAGFKLSGGYPAADSAKTAALQNVNCESCHGPGGKHVTAKMADKKTTIAKGGEALCRSCHTPETSPAFKYEEFKAKGVHQVAATK
jgi:hypothetical protein